MNYLCVVLALCANQHHTNIDLFEHTNIYCTYRCDISTNAHGNHHHINVCGNDIQMVVKGGSSYHTDVYDFTGLGPGQDWQNHGTHFRMRYGVVHNGTMSEVTAGGVLSSEGVIGDGRGDGGGGGGVLCNTWCHHQESSTIP